MKLGGNYMKSSIQIKEFILSTIITFVMGLLILLTKLSFAYNFIVFIGIECIIGYIYRNHILVKKTYLQNQAAILQLRNASTSETDDSRQKFNAAYYDLYNSFSFNRTMIMFKAMFLGLSFTSVVFAGLQDLLLYVLLGMGVMLACMLAVCFTLFQFRKERIIMSLINMRKDDWYSDYTEEELELVSKLV